MKYFDMNLHLFDGEGAAGAGAEGAGGTEGTAGMEGAEGGGEPQRDFDAEFQELIQGEYKKQYDAAMREAAKESRKQGKKTEGELADARELLSLVGERYGQDGTNLAALREALLADKGYLEEEAMEKGISIDQLSEMKRMERENKVVKEQLLAAKRQQEFEQKFSGWMQEAEALSDTYPELDLMAEFEDPQFIRMLDAGVSVKTAYQAKYFDDMMQGIVQHTARTAEKKVMDSVRANGARPREAGASGGGAGDRKIDPAKMTAKERQELAERVLRNPEERITFQ